MNDQLAKLMMDQADYLLESAQSEMLRSWDDVVPQMICNNARRSIAKYLTGFLLKNGVEQKETGSLDDLVDKCIAIDPKFKSLKLDKMYCGGNESNDVNYCTDSNKVEECIQLAKQAKNLVADKPWPVSKHVK